MARKDGYVTAASTIKMKRTDIINNCLEPQIFYDDWKEARDSQRDWVSDRTKIKKLPRIKLNYVVYRKRNSFTRKDVNEKNKLMLKRREAMKDKLDP